MPTISISNLDRYQHYKDRHMVWFKWYIDTLQDEAFMEMSEKDRWIFIGLICLACKSDNKITYNPKWLERTLNTTNIKPSIKNLESIKMIAICYPDDIPIREEKRREEKRRKDIGAPPEHHGDAQSKAQLELLEENLIKMVMEHFNKACHKGLALTPERISIIKKCFDAGRTIDQIKKAIDNFSRDDWEERHKFCDLIYCIGKQRGKPDAFDKWISWKPAAGSKKSGHAASAEDLGNYERQI